MESNGASPSMRSPVAVSAYFALPLLALSSLFFPLTASDPRIAVAGLLCGKTNGTAIPTFTAVMREILDSVTDGRWGNYSLASPPTAVYGLAQCHGDLIETDCLLCFAESRTRIPRCLPSFGRLYLDGCFLRYDGYDFYNETVDPTHDMLNCSSNSTVPAERAAEFSKRVDQVLRNVSASAVQNGGFAVAGEDGAKGATGVYALAQCWSTLDAGGCRVCLENAVSKARNCTPAGEARAMNAGCFLRYSTTKFYSVPVSGGPSRVRITVAIASSAAAAISLVLIGTYIGYKKYSKEKLVRHSLMRLPASVRKSSLYFKYETLEKATDFFHDSRKLGQGGAGSVYKGILPDGKVVAVKRLVFNTRQWVDDFFNEVNLINGIQHKNLVRLLGCSIEGPESLLVYEYIPNRSLDQVLFVNDATHVLTWEERLRIITGTAEGLAYLHGGCGVKIIHRDIKSSNILLDENLMAKIADFGLARCIAPDKSHLSTGIAGTLGYMAPEYLVRGQLTEKADVYAFGVLVLEILSGRKSSIFAQGSDSVLQSVWKHYKSNNLAACVDPALRGKFPVQEASDVLQISLLCTQASMELRPTMSGVVEMLRKRDHAVPEPKQPPFLNASVLSDESSTRSSYTHTWLSNQLMVSEVSSSMTGSPRTNSRYAVKASELR
ncbi:cysteine-rich receptor-like protein kinase 42 [Eucalyptus grandis]|uniref:cysteine-rich receptor-like protein kinase 42 n=1 Tax=Eucalyptus grandis TaxID=71139 RepID=UPI00192E7A3D|nr:cysteine-rich receptor-like protein kinase 42 [Eucalyptus grandis]